MRNFLALSVLVICLFACQAGVDPNSPNPGIDSSSKKLFTKFQTHSQWGGNHYETVYVDSINHRIISKYYWGDTLTPPMDTRYYQYDAQGRLVKVYGVNDPRTITVSRSINGIQFKISDTANTFIENLTWTNINANLRNYRISFAKPGWTTRNSDVIVRDGKYIESVKDTAIMANGTGITHMQYHYSAAMKLDSVTWDYWLDGWHVTSDVVAFEHGQHDPFWTSFTQKIQGTDLQWYDDHLFSQTEFGFFSFPSSNIRTRGPSAVVLFRDGRPVKNTGTSTTVPSNQVLSYQYDYNYTFDSLSRIKSMIGASAVYGTDTVRITYY